MENKSYQSCDSADINHIGLGIGIFVLVLDQDKDAKIAKVDKKSESILKRQKSDLLLGTARFSYANTSLHQVFFRKIPKGG